VSPARIRIGTRGSALALWQARHVADRLTAVTPGAQIELVEIVSTGDRITDVPLTNVEGTGFFTATLERALLAGEVDVAVHSHKDLPVTATRDLVVAAVPARGPVEDVLCARNGATLATLPPAARIGTCSARRTAQVRARRPDLDVRPLRGNVPTRVGRVTAGELDAVVLARAGLVRLGLDGHVTETFTVTGFLQAPAQGALAVQCRVGDAAIVAAIGRLDDDGTRRAVAAERAVLHALGGGCSVPVGAVAVARGDGVALTAAVFSLDGTRVVSAQGHGRHAAAVGAATARRLLDLGADRLLAEFARASRLAAPAAEVWS
jgi:hydroxymethylbilane synthase